jgi:hypothetical protein
LEGIKKLVKPSIILLLATAANQQGDPKQSVFPAQQRLGIQFFYNFGEVVRQSFINYTEAIILKKRFLSVIPKIMK